MLHSFTMLSIFYLHNTYLPLLERRVWLSPGGLLQQGEALFAEVQRVLHHDYAPLSAPGLRQAPHRLLLPPLQGGEAARHPGEATL